MKFQGDVYLVVVLLDIVEQLEKFTSSWNRMRIPELKFGTSSTQRYSLTLMGQEEWSVTQTGCASLRACYHGAQQITNKSTWGSKVHLGWSLNQDEWLFLTVGVSKSTFKQHRSSAKFSTAMSTAMIYHYFADANQTAAWHLQRTPWKPSEWQAPWPTRTDQSAIIQKDLSSIIRIISMW